MLCITTEHLVLSFEVCKKVNYLTSTVAPAASNSVLAASASSFDASSFEIPALTTAPASSAIAFASLSPKPVNPLTALITLIFLAPASFKITSNSVFSSAASAAPPAAPATATGVADTPNFSSNSLTNSESSNTLSFYIYINKLFFYSSLDYNHHRSAIKQLPLLF